MNGLLADINFIGSMRHIMRVLNSQEWSAYWQSLDIGILDFTQLYLPANSSDRLIWNLCQEQGLILITENRNDDGPDSLNRTILDSNQLNSLPVFTVSNAQRVMTNKKYAYDISVGLLEYCYDIRDNPESILGAGRLYLPKVNS